jgi:hypothetical protein
LNEKIPIAILGVGEHGKKHARELKQVPAAELVGVYDLRAERTREIAAVRAVSVVIPTTDHAAVARQAFARGVDVLLEKPITRTLDEATELMELAERGGRILQVGHLERFNPGVVAAQAATTHPMFFEIHRLGVFSPRSLDVDVVFDLRIPPGGRCAPWACPCFLTRWTSPTPGWNSKMAPSPI